MRCLERRALARAAAVVAISQFTAAQLASLGRSPASVDIISPALPEAFLDRPRDEQRIAALCQRYRVAGGPVLLSLGRLVLRKGVDRVLGALPAILEQFPKAIYLIGGSGPDEPKLRALVTGLGLEERVRFLGYVPRDDLVSLYDLADLFLMPSRLTPAGDSEGFGIVFLEAQARGVPVIGGLAGGMADAVAPGGGVLVDGAESSSIAEAALRILSLPGFGCEMGQVGRQYVRQEMTMSMQKRKLDQLFDRLEGTSNARRA